MKTLAIEYFIETKNNFPEKIAIVDREKTITFSQLWEKAVCWGYQIQQSLDGKNSIPIVVTIPKSIEAVIAYLAIQLSGNIYVPFDVDSPKERCRRMIEVLGHHGIFRWDKEGLYLDDQKLDETANALEKKEEALLVSCHKRTGLEPLYIIFTSGSTGFPKGVTISNAAAIDYAQWVIEIYQVTEGEIIGNQAPFFFDNSVLDLYVTFMKGCTLHLIPKENFMFLPSLMEYLQKNSVNFIFFVPSILANIATLHLLADYPLPKMKKVLFAGEFMPLGTLKYLKKCLPNALLSNLYGPTEITVDAIYWIFDEDVFSLEKVPLGIPCRNKRIVFLDEGNNIIETPDTVGEICVSGIGVSLGYWNRPEKNREVFIQHPGHNAYRDILYKTGDLGYVAAKDNLIYMIGRKDDQIKHLGYRIELGEIETALQTIAEVVQASVQYDTEKKAIVAFYASKDGSPIGNMRKILSTSLPNYMVPKEFILVKQLPFKANGKVDKAELWELRQGIRK